MANEPSRRIAPWLALVASIPLAVPPAGRIWYLIDNGLGFGRYFGRYSGIYFAVAWIALTLTFALIAMRTDVVAQTARLIQQPASTTYVLAVAVMSAIFMAEFQARWALVVVTCAAIALVLRPGSLESRIFWLVVALPFSFYSIIGTIFVVGSPTLPVTIGIWKTTAWHWKAPASGKRPPARIALIAWTATTVVAVSMAFGASRLQRLL